MNYLKIFLLLFTFAESTQLNIIDKTFVLVMKSGEIIYRYSFYDEFWQNIGRYLGQYKNQTITINGMIVYQFNSYNEKSSHNIE